METDVAIECAGCTLHGSLMLPDTGAPVAAVLIHPGSGPTDRDGNSHLGLKTDAYRMLAIELSAHGVASLRIDKRAIGKSVVDASETPVLTVGHTVDDALAWLAWLRDCLDCPVSIVGHSEGGLIALLAAQASTVELQGLVLLSTSSMRFGDLILGQLENKVSEQDYHWSCKALAALTEGKQVCDVPPGLEPVFRQDVQTYLRSRLSVDPMLVAKSIKVPFAVIGGSEDKQVESADSRRLLDAPASRHFVEIEGMTHTLKRVKSPVSDQSAEYTDPSLPLAPDLVKHIADFLLSLPAGE